MVTTSVAGLVPAVGVEEAAHPDGQEPEGGAADGRAGSLESLEPAADEAAAGGSAPTAAADASPEPLGSRGEQAAGVPSEGLLGAQQAASPEAELLLALEASRAADARLVAEAVAAAARRAAEAAAADIG